MPNIKDFPLLYLTQQKHTKEESYKNKSLDILYCLSGEVTLTAGDGVPRTYPADNLTLIPSGTLYSIRPGADCIILRLGILPYFIEQYAGPEHRLFCDSLLESDRDYNRIKQILTTISSEFLDYSQDHHLTILGRLFELMDELSRNHLNSYAHKEASSGKYGERLRQIETFINANYQNPLTLSDLADHLHLTPQYLSAFFKTNFGEHFSSYLNRIRMEFALRDMRYSEKSITEIALSCGFSNMSTFNRNFRQFYGTSPRRFRAEMADENAEASQSRIPAKVDYDPIANVSEHRRVTADVSSGTPFTRNMCRIINIGQAANLGHSDFRKYLLESKEALGFTFVRLEGLLSSSMILRLSGTDRYSMSMVAGALDFLYDNQLIPLIELSRNSLHTLNIGAGSPDGMRPLRHGPAFLRQLEEFLRFVLTRYDPAWCSKWIFELYKPPALPDPAYIEDFAAIRRVIRRYLPEAELGGPGFTTSVSSDDFLVFLNAMKESGELPDFLSMHFFAIQYESDKGAGSMNLSSVSRPLVRQQQWVLEQTAAVWGKEVPLFITEFNSCLIPDTFISSSCFQGAFLCHNLLLLHEQSPLIAYWMLTDSAFTNMNQVYRSYSGVGLFNRAGLPMPSFFALSFLTKLGNRLIRRGEHYCITSSGQDHYQVLTYYYVRFTNFYSLQANHSHSIQDVYSYFEAVSPIEMHFRLTGITPGIYRIRRYLLDRAHGSVFDIYLGSLNAGNLGEDDFMSRTLTVPPEENDYLKRTCVPEERTVFVRAETELELNIRLSVHSVCLWDIRLEM